MGRRTMLALSAAAVMLLPLPMARSASADDGWVKVPVRFYVTGAHTLDPSSACDDSGQLCLGTQVYDRNPLAGDVNGVSMHATAFSGRRDGSWYLYSDVGLFVGSVTTCGTGAILLSTFTSASASSGPQPSTYVFEPRSGSGDLKGMSGSVTDQPDGSISGVLRCHRPRH
jgi:hypothetical protein